MWHWTVTNCAWLKARNLANLQLGTALVSQLGLGAYCLPSNGIKTNAMEWTHGRFIAEVNLKSTWKQKVRPFLPKPDLHQKSEFCHFSLGGKKSHMQMKTEGNINKNLPRVGQVSRVGHQNLVKEMGGRWGWVGPKVCRECKSVLAHEGHRDTKLQVRCAWRVVIADWSHRRH